MGRTETGSASDETIRHIPKFGGELWYVNGGITASGNGITPDGAFKTIGEAITACSAGDAITIMAATYTETGLDVNKASVELWSEIGVIIAPASGVGLTISGNFCKIIGEMLIMATSAAGLVVTGTNFVGSDIKSNNATGAGTDCYQISGIGATLTRCAGAFPSATYAGFNITGGQVRLFACSTVGDTTSCGYRINGGADTGVLSDCTSVGHQTCGYYIDTGSSARTIVDCSSGAGDGKWRDIDDTNIWSGFTYAETIYKEITLNASTNYNLFQVTGTVEIEEIYGHVTTTLVGANTEVYFDLYSTTSADPITKITDTDLGTASVGSIVIKTEDPGKKVTFLTAGAPTVDKGTDPKKKKVTLTADVAQTTYIRRNVTGGDTGGVMHFHATWRPLTDNGFIEVV